jgi:hypothetical protein
MRNKAGNSARSRVAPVNLLQVMAQPAFEERLMQMQRRRRHGIDSQNGNTRETAFQSGLEQFPSFTVLFEVDVVNPLNVHGCVRRQSI